MPRAPVIVFVSLLPLATACSERVPSAPRAVPALTSRVLTCRADVRAGTLSCAAPGATRGVSGASQISADVILGGQGLYVQLSSTNVSYDATNQIFQADVTVQNLTPLTLGTPDGATVTGVKVFFHTGPNVVSGTGAVSVANADGVGTFTGSNQPFFLYPEILTRGQVSVARTWQWAVPSTARTFVFEVLVDAAAPPVTVSSVFVTPSGATISTAGGTQIFMAQARDRFGNVIPAKTFTWATLNSNVATITSGAGVATAVASGQATIAASVEGVSGYALLTVAIPALTPVSAWSAMPSGTTQEIDHVWSASSSDVYTVGAGGTILRRNGPAWSAMTSGTSQSLHGIWGSSPSDIYAVGDGGTILRYNGTSWSQMTSGEFQNLFSIWGSSPADIHAACCGGATLRYDGSNWQRTSGAPPVLLFGVWGTSSSNIYAVGGSGTILRFDGTSWSQMLSGTTRDLLGIWGTSQSEIYAVGDRGTILRYNGASWTPMVSGTTAVLFDVWGAAANEIYAVGAVGTIVRYDGTNWGPMGSGTSALLRGIWGTSTGPVYVVGDGGTILQGARIAAPASLVLTPKSLITDVGVSTATTVVVKDASGNIIPNPAVTYVSRNASVASVSGTGTISVVARGQSIVVATATGGTSPSDSLLAVAAVPGGPVLVTDIAQITYKTDTVFTATVIMDMRASRELLGSTTATVTWNPSVLVYQATANGGSGVSPTVNASSAASGSLTLAMADANGFGGRVELLRITFKVGSGAGAVGSLALSTSEVTGAITFTDLLAKTVAVTHPLSTR